MRNYASPIIGTLPIADVDTALVMKVIEPLWRRRTATASRIRSRIEAVLDDAKVRGLRSGENPARWKGHLDHLLPDRQAVKSTKHFTALSYNEVPAFMARLREEDSVGGGTLSGISHPHGGAADAGLEAPCVPRSATSWSGPGLFRASA